MDGGIVVEEPRPLTAADGNKVVGLHRAQIGGLTLGQLPAGSYTRINQNLEII